MRFLLFLSLTLSFVLAHAQFDDSSKASKDESGLEEIYDRFETETDKAENARAKKVDAQKEKKIEKEVNSISDLGTLAPFKDIAVIQRKFLPRTQRFEFSGNLLISTNNQFFNNIGLGLKAAYGFTEAYGIEATYLFLGSSARDVTTSLEDNQKIATTSLVQPESYMGLSFKWTPVYGKIAWFERKIIPFDLYFTPGLGVTSTANGGSESTVSIGAGQLFALSKATAVRWDFVWNFYQATTVDNGQSSKQNQNDLFLMIGYSFLFPEAKYR